MGGAERSIFELTTALSSLDFKVDILAAKGQTDAKNIHILCQNTSGKRTCHNAFGKALKNHLAENHYDIVHSVLPFDFVDIYQPRGGSYAESIVQNAASYQNNFKAAYKRVTAFTNFRRTTLLQAERKLCKNPHGPTIAALSNYVADQFKKHYNTDEKRIVVIHNGVKTNRRIYQAEADKLRAQILAQFALKEADNPVFFLFVANNFRLKGLESLIKAMSAIRSKNRQHEYLLVAGHGKPHKYRHLAKKLKVHKKILFLGTIRHIQNALSITDVAVLPTFYDPSSRFILEALAAEKPVITTEFNGATDLFTNDRHGKVIDTAENITALSNALSHYTDINNIRQTSQAIIEDNLKEKVSISRVAKELESLYKSIIEKRRQ